MPYPPPPGPPTVGFFQGIGRLIAPAIPDVTGHGGEFLETDGIIPQWEPVSGVLPDQTGHGGEFLTTDGATASWAALTDTLPTQTGHGGEFLTTDGAVASWAPAEVGSPFDVTLHGAVANDTTNDFGQAFYNTQAAWTQSPNNLFPLIVALNKVGGMYLPAGQFYTSVPLCSMGGMDMAGAGKYLSVVSPGIGNGLTSDVATFAGPIVYACPPYTPAQRAATTSFPTYTAALVGATGQALVLLDIDAAGLSGLSSLWLHDAWCWNTWIGNTYTLTNFSLQFWVQVDETPVLNLFRGIIGSRGPTVWTDRGADDTDIAFGVYCTSNGSDLFLKAYLTTSSDFTGPYNPPKKGTIHTITSTAITAGTPIHVEIDYNGVFFDFYVDGVNQGHVSASGPIIRAPWEGVAIGGQGIETLDIPLPLSGINGAIDSIRLSKVARHTGAGSFTPPAAKYSWDSDTYALYNWDQGEKTVQPVDSNSNPVGPLLTLPFLVGQTVAGTGFGSFQEPPLTGPVPHYIRLFGPVVSPNNYFHDFGLNGWQGASGLATCNAWWNNIDRLAVVGMTRYGIRIGTAVSFYTTIRNSEAVWCSGIGMQAFGTVEDAIVIGNGIGIHLMGGPEIVRANAQPAYNSYASFLIEGYGGSIRLDSLTNDDEVWNFTRQIGVGVAFGFMGSLTDTNSFWSSNGSDAAPFLYLSMPIDGTATHTGSRFVPNAQGGQGADAPPCSMIAFSVGTVDKNILLINCTKDDRNSPQLPESNIPSRLGKWDGAGTTNQRSLSASAVAANNLAGKFTIQAGFTYGGPNFVNPEPDPNYTVQITPLSYVGSAPAAGSNRIMFPVETHQEGFRAFVEADPGGTCTATYAYQITRTKPPPLYFDYVPTIPSNFSNPLVAASLTGPFAVGVTLVPVGGNAFFYDAASPYQSILEAGTTVGGTDWWELAIYNNSFWINTFLGAVEIQLGASVVNGQLRHILNPGAHNIVLHYHGTNATMYIDGQGAVLTGIATPTGAQQTPIYVGARFDASAPLTTATLRNLKIDVTPDVVISNDNDIGPGLQAQGAFFGDQWTLGAASTPPNAFASSIANTKYGTTFYWIAAKPSGQLTAAVGLDENILETLWKPWQGAVTAPPLDGLCIMAGIEDIIRNKTATAIYAALLQVLEGAKATNTWSPPTSATFPTNQFAFAIWDPGPDPVTVSSTCVINGHTFNGITGSDTAVVNDMIAQINGHGPTAALVTPSFRTEADGSHTVLLTAVAVGTAGNGITVSTDGAGGSSCYGDVGGGFAAVALSVATINGTDNYVIIAGIRFVCNFDTDAATTVNNLVALVNADPTVSVLVTASNVANKMFIEANASGNAGNAISCLGNGENTPSAAGRSPWSSFPAAHMTGGFNGAIQNGTGTILFCTVPPIGTIPGTTGAMETELAALNVSINAYVGAGVSIVDVNTALADPGTPTNLLPAYDTGSGILNDAGHAALVALIGPLLP